MTGFMGCSEAFVRRPGPQRAHLAVAREIWESVLVPARGFVDDRSGTKFGSAASQLIGRVCVQKHVEVEADCALTVDLTWACSGRQPVETVGLFTPWFQGQGSFILRSQARDATRIKLWQPQTQVFSWLRRPDGLWSTCS